MAYKDPEVNRQVAKKWYEDNKNRLKSDPVYLEKRKTFVRKWRENNREASMLCAAKARAKRLGQEFSLVVEDIKIPEVCPVLGIPLYFTPGKQTDNTPALDRKDNSKGYTKDNSFVISHKANRVKADLNPEEVLALYNYMKF